MTAPRVTYTEAQAMEAVARSRSYGHVERRFCSLYPVKHHEQLREDLAHMSWLAVGRSTVSDNAVHKWMLWYERDAEAA